MRHTAALSKILDFNYGKSLPERSRRPGDVPVYGSGGVVGTHTDALVRGPGIVVGRKGSIGTVFYEKNDFFPIDTVYYVEPKGPGFDKRFLFYALQNLPLDSLNSDAAVPGLNRTAALKQELNYPDKKEQERIASILSAYDDLIGNNLRRIKLLEESARLLYREWFVHLRFPGHEHVKIVDGVPEGWEKLLLEEVLVLQRGFDLPAHMRKDGDIPVYASTGINGFHDTAKVSGPGVVTGRSGTLGVVTYVPGDYWPLNTALWVRDFKRVSPFFATQLLRDIHLDKYNGGVSVPTLDRKVIHRIPVLLPPESLGALFDDALEPISAQIQTLEQQNQALRKARDILLPRLMNGSIAV